MTLRRRLERLETRSAGNGRCPACPPIAFVTVDADGNLLEGEYPKPCSRCGGPYDGSIRFIEVVMPRDAGDTASD